MTENERKIAELNRLHSELHEKYTYLKELIIESEKEKWELIRKIDDIDMERQALINQEVQKFYNLK